MNAVLLAVLIMLALSLARANVVLSIVIAAVIGGVTGGLSLDQTLAAFGNGLGPGANVALSYALLGAFAVAIDNSGLPSVMSRRIIDYLGMDAAAGQRVRHTLLAGILLMAICSQNIIPVHIAFIPVLIPPLLAIMQRFRLDRRLVACVLCFGLTAPYLLLPIGFGGIYLETILLGNLRASGLTDIASHQVPLAMAIPVAGMLCGLLVAMFFSYAAPRDYQQVSAPAPSLAHTVSRQNLAYILLAIAVAFAVQLLAKSVLLGALAGYIVFSVTGIVHWRESNDVFIRGMKMMAQIGFVMIAAAGFTAVARETGQIDSLVASASGLLQYQPSLGIVVLLLVGLVITLGIGSSFSTVPIIAAIYVPLAAELGLSTMATIALVGTAGALGDAGSPASDSTLGPTMGLNADGQHDHIWDTVVPTFIHYNIPLLAFGWLAVQML